MAPPGILQLFCPPVPLLIRGKGAEHQGARVNCCDRSFHLAWLRIISEFEASVQDHSGIFKVLQFSVN